MKKYFIVAMLLLAVGVYLTTKFIGQEGVSKEAYVAKPAAEQSLRQTTEGAVLGYADATDTYAWLGIPFAAPPVNELRWRAPRPATVRQETLLATNYNNTCLQLWGPLSVEKGKEGDVSGSEDCLYLNLWAPKSASPKSASSAGANLPVMVWIHGGGNTIGTANTYPSNFLSGNENVVVVTINYRLGLLGWMTHPALREGVDSIDGSGNYGTLDMIAALSWVKNNIANFGGNPNNVTIFGESAGGRNVYSLMMSPIAKGLFHRAISQSGSLASSPMWRAENYADDAKPGMQTGSREWLLSQLINDGKAEDRSAARTQLEAMSNADIKTYMYARTPTQIMQGIKGFAGMFEAPQNLRDGAVLPSGSQLALLNDTANYNNVPLMAGTNRDEAKLFMAQSPRYVKKLFGIFPRIKDIDAYNRASAYATDMWKAASVDEPAAIISQHSDQPVYAYRWDWDEGAKSWAVDFSQLIGAAHGLEVQYVFGNAASGSWIPGLYNDNNGPGRDKLSNQMQSYWAEFARSGNPGKGSRGDLTEWQAWSNEGNNLMLLDTDSGGGLRMVNEPMTVAMLKQRVAEDSFLDQSQKCAHFSELFFHANDGEDYWDPAEFNRLGCEGDAPWDVRVAR